MGPISRGTDAARTAAAGQTPSGVPKTAPSAFDRLRADLNQHSSGAATLPPKVTSVTDQQKQFLGNDLRQRLEAVKSPQDVFGPDMQRLRGGIADLNKQVAALPDTSALDPLRQRLQSIESDFNASTNLLKSPGALDNPNRLLEMQMEVYKLSSNVEILSRTVSEAASGAKTILQTQV